LSKVKQGAAHTRIRLKGAIFYVFVTFFAYSALFSTGAFGISDVILSPTEEFVCVDQMPVKIDIDATALGFYVQLAI